MACLGGLQFGCLGGYCCLRVILGAWLLQVTCVLWFLVMVAGGDLRVFDMFVFVLGLCIGCVFVGFPSILCFDYFDVTMVLLVVGNRADACFSGG